MSKSVRLGLAIALIAILIDQLSKWWILVKVMNPPKIVQVTQNFNLVLTWNRGVSFGLFNDQGNWGVWIFSTLALIIVVILVFWLRRAETKLISVALGLIIGGALGNVIDRINHTAVVDFLDFYIGKIHWPAFNAADSFITVGAVVLIVDSLFVRQKCNSDASNKKSSS